MLFANTGKLCHQIRFYLHNPGQGAGIGRWGNAAIPGSLVFPQGGSRHLRRNEQQLGNFGRSFRHVHFFAPEVDVPGKRDEVLLDGVTAYLFLHMYTSFLLLLHNSSQMPVQRS